MVRINIENILLNLFNADARDDENIPLLTILTIKSLFPIKNRIGNKINYKRFNEELRLWKYYRIDDNISLLNILNDIDKEIYFNIKDNTIYSRVIPIVISNSEYKIIEDEVIKNILFTSGNIELLLEWLLISKALYLILSKKENIINELKEYIINLSQIDFLEDYKKHYRINLDEDLNYYKIKFERTRLDLINILNNIPIKNYDNINDIMKILEGNKPDSIFGEIIYSSLENNKEKSKTKAVYDNMNEYILKLRKGRINPKDLVIDKYILPDIFKYGEGDVFFHSLLSSSKVIKKECKEGVLTSLIESKSGIYLFKKDPV